MTIFSGKKGVQKILSIFWAIFPAGKKGMEMWQLVLLILAIILFLFLLIWYGALGSEINILLDKWGELF